MPSHAAIIEKPVILSPDLSVEKALKELKKKKTTFAAVVDEEGLLVGLFSHKAVLNNLLPVSVAISDGIVMDIPVKVAPGIAKRLKKVYPAKVGDLMQRKNLALVFPQTPIWECVNKLLTIGGPVFMVEDKTGRFLGIIDEASVVFELQRLQEGEGK